MSMILKIVIFNFRWIFGKGYREVRVDIVCRNFVFIFFWVKLYTLRRTWKFSRLVFVCRAIGLRIRENIINEIVIDDFYGREDFELDVEGF